jgi:apolipoprotein N-acyltransferase
LRPATRKPKPLAGLEAVTQRLEEKRAAERGAEIAPNESLPPEVSPWLSSYRNLAIALLLAAVWVTTETIRGTLFSGWGWNTLGHALHAQWALIQIAEYTGVPGLSFLVAMTNVVLLATVRRFIAEAQEKRRRPHFEFTLTMAAIVGVMSFGWRAVQLRGETTSVRIAALQPQIPREDKFNRASTEQIFATFSRLDQVALQSKPDLIMWPESSMPGPVLTDDDSYRFVMAFAQQAKTDLLLGTIDVDQQAAYNAAMLVTNGGADAQMYRKVHLVPFGEYVPGRHTLPGIAAIVGDQVPEDFGFGREFKVFKTSRNDLRIAPLICFEDTIGELTRQFVRRGANLLANVTNDGWFLHTAGSRQHLDNAIFRCVETRLPLVRSANTGVTCFVNEFGRVTQMLTDDKGSQFTQGVLTGEVRVPVDYEPTFYVLHGEVFAQGCAIVSTLLLAFLLVRPFVFRHA